MIGTNRVIYVPNVRGQGGLSFNEGARSSHRVLQRSQQSISAFVPPDELGRLALRVQRSPKHLALRRQQHGLVTILANWAPKHYAELSFADFERSHIDPEHKLDIQFELAMFHTGSVETPANREERR